MVGHGVLAPAWHQTRIEVTSGLPTKVDAAALQKLWKLRFDPIVCRHMRLELETDVGVYLTGHYHCVECGQAMLSTSQARGEDHTTGLFTL